MKQKYLKPQTTIMTVSMKSNLMGISNLNTNTSASPEAPEDAKERRDNGGWEKDGLW